MTIWRIGGGGGVLGTRTSYRSNFLHFHAVSHKNLAKKSPPPVWKILDPPLMAARFSHCGKFLKYPPNLCASSVI